MSDIKICVNNLWVANDIVKITDIHPNMKMVYSLIKKASNKFRFYLY